jgi:aminoglycoside 2'-N-acetyltransferase I
VVELRTAHTAELDEATLTAARELLETAFAGDFSEHDWEHCVGGLHALSYEDGELVGHAALVERRLLHGGRALRAGYVEGVGVRPDRRRRGHGGALMDPLERRVRSDYDLGALGATDQAGRFYRARGWLLWEGPTSALTPTGLVRTEEDDGCVHILPMDGVSLDRAGELTCDWREGELW